MSVKVAATSGSSGPAIVAGATDPPYTFHFTTEFQGQSFAGLLVFFDGLFGEGVLVFDIEPEASIEAHPLICDPG